MWMFPTLALLAIQVDIQHGWRYSVGVQVEGENTWKGKISPQSCLMTKIQVKACRDISSHQYKTIPMGRVPRVSGDTGVSQPLGCGSVAHGGRGSPSPPPGSTVCCLLFKHSSCLSTTLALQGWSYQRALLLPSLTFPWACITPNKHSLRVIVNFNGSVLASTV